MADNDHVDVHLLFTVMGRIVSDRSWKEWMGTSCGKSS